MGCLRVLQKQTILTVDNSDIKKELKYFAEKLYSLFIFTNSYLNLMLSSQHVCCMFIYLIQKAFEHIINLSPEEL